MNIKYSIIIPHYDIPDLLVRCIRSIPVREDIQVIVIDDCSPLCENCFSRNSELSRPYLEIHCLPARGGAGKARNAGLDYAKGKWIIFADADDFFVDNIGELLDKYYESEADVVHFMVDSKDSITLKPSDRHIQINSAVEAYYHNDVSALEAALWNPVVWGQMITRRLICENALKFEEIKVSEDVLFAAKVSCLAKHIEFCKDTFYVVTIRERGLHFKSENDCEGFIAHQFVEVRFNKYIRKFGVNRQPVCIPRSIFIAGRLFGIKTAVAMIVTALSEHALLYGFKEYIQRKFLS